MNATSVILEGGRNSRGRRTHLELQTLSSYALFPGQIVLVQGINSTGRKMVAQRIVDGCPCPHVKSLPTNLLNYHYSADYQGGKALQVITAAGPFTTSDNVTYEPLENLLGRALMSKPDVLILIGPFVDITQPIIASGEITLPDNAGEHNASYEMVFIEKIIRDSLHALFNAEVDHGVLPTHIVIIPSLNDAHHEYVFPQPPFGSHDPITSAFFNEKLGELDIPYSLDNDKKRVHLLPNPCMFRSVVLCSYYYCYYYHHHSYCYCSNSPSNCCCCYLYHLVLIRSSTQLCIYIYIHLHTLSLIR
jgi:DNA polymerase alpha subunit B